jgi:hypothetical protein
MTRKDYVIIADSIKASRENWEGFTPEAQEAIDGLARKVASALWRDNPTRFDRARFLTACGVN